MDSHSERFRSVAAARFSGRLCGEVLERRVEFTLVARGERGLQALGELVDCEAPGGGVLAQAASGVFKLGVGGAQVVTARRGRARGSGRVGRGGLALHACCELAVEAEGDVVGHAGTRQLVQIARVEDQQERAAGCGV